MPMVDVYARAGTFSDSHQLAVDLAAELLSYHGVYHHGAEPWLTVCRKRRAARFAPAQLEADVL